MSNTSLPDEQQLLKQVASGDKNAYTILFHHYSKQVFDAGMLYLKDNGLSQEIVQEIFLKVWLKKEEMDTVKNFKDYLFILTRNHIYDGFKKQIVRLKAYDFHQQHQPATENGTDHLLIEREYKKLLDAAISCLPPERKKVYLARNQGFSNEEISIRLNISIHTVKKQMSIAVHTVRAFVKAHLQNDILLLVIIYLTTHK